MGSWSKGSSHSAIPGLQGSIQGWGVSACQCILAGSPG
jgi:hypothetical protein